MGRGEAFNSQSQTIILNVLSFFKREKDVDGPVLPFAAVYARCAAACNVSEQTLRNIQRRLKASASDAPDDRLPRPSTPGKMKATKEKQTRKRKVPPKRFGPLKVPPHKKDAPPNTIPPKVHNHHTATNINAEQTVKYVQTPLVHAQHVQILKPPLEFAKSSDVDLSAPVENCDEFTREMLNSMSQGNLSLWSERYNIVPTIQDVNECRDIMHLEEPSLQRL